MVDAPPVQGYAANPGGTKAGDYIMAVKKVNTEGRTAFNIIDQISDDPNSLLVTMTVRTTASGTNKYPPYSSAKYIVRDVTMRR